MEVIEHKHLIVRAETEFAPTEVELHDWLRGLVHKLRMNILSGPHTGCVTDVPGNNGPTGVVVIETSHIACHVWTDPVDHNLIQLDVYTCGKMDVDAVIAHLNQYNIIKYDVKLFDREYELIEMKVEE